MFYWSALFMNCAHEYLAVKTFKWKKKKNQGRKSVDKIELIWKWSSVNSVNFFTAGMNISVWLFILVSVTAVSASSQSDQNKSEESENESAQSFVNKKSQKILFGTLNTQSHTIVSFTTSTVFFSCLVTFTTVDGGATPICSGKKRRRRRRVTLGLEGVSDSEMWDYKCINSSIAEISGLEVIWQLLNLIPKNLILL